MYTETADNSTTSAQCNPLHDEAKIASWIAEITDTPESLVREKLRAEYDNPGSTVYEALRQSGITPYTWSDDLASFYEKTDAFLYELVIWNLNRMKGWMRNSVAKHLAKANNIARGKAGILERTEPLQQQLNVLNIGDGLGFDSVHFAQAGHKMTYFELPGYSETFARNVFADCGVDITMLTNPDEIPREAFDAVVCLDVLEHVPDPPAFVKMIAGYLKPGGIFIVNAPFAVIHHTTATHLKSNRRYSGSLALYKQAGFSVLDGEIGWTPIVLQREIKEIAAPSPWTAKRLAIRLGGYALSLGRLPILPLGLGDRFRRRQGRWFDDR